LTNIICFSSKNIKGNLAALRGGHKKDVVFADVAIANQRKDNTILSDI